MGDVEHLLGTAGVSALPIDVIAVAHYCGLHLHFRDDLPDKVGGLLYRGPVRDVVVVNARHSHVRQRFTIGHEIGHWFFGDQGTSFEGIHRDYFNDPERAVDAFAAELLMPEHMLRGEIASYAQLAPLAQRFGVSCSAMRRRLNDLQMTLAHTGTSISPDRRTAIEISEEMEEHRFLADEDVLFTR